MTDPHDPELQDSPTETYPAQPPVPTEAPVERRRYVRSARHVQPAGRRALELARADLAAADAAPLARAAARPGPAPAPGHVGRVIWRCVVIIALLAGVVGSAGTYLALQYGPGLTSDVGVSTLAVDSTQRSGTGCRARKRSSSTSRPRSPRPPKSVSPAVVTITVRAGEATDPFQLPETGVGSGIIYDAATAGS